jgi:hypothetical protein
VQFLGLRTQIGCVCGGCQVCVRTDPELHQAHTVEARPIVQLMNTVLVGLRRQVKEEPKEE